MPSISTLKSSYGSNPACVRPRCFRSPAHSSVPPSRTTASARSSCPCRLRQLRTAPIRPVPSLPPCSSLGRPTLTPRRSPLAAAFLAQLLLPDRSPRPCPTGRRRRPCAPLPRRPRVTWSPPDRGVGTKVPPLPSVSAPLFVPLCPSLCVFSPFRPTPLVPPPQRELGGAQETQISPRMGEEESRHRARMAAASLWWSGGGRRRQTTDADADGGGEREEAGKTKRRGPRRADASLPAGPGGNVPARFRGGRGRGPGDRSEDEEGSPNPPAPPFWSLLCKERMQQGLIEVGTQQPCSDVGAKQGGRRTRGSCSLPVPVPIAFLGSSPLRPHLHAVAAPHFPVPASRGVALVLSLSDARQPNLHRHIVLTNSSSEIMKKLDSSKVLELISQEWFFAIVGQVLAWRGYPSVTCRQGNQDAYKISELIVSFQVAHCEGCSKEHPILESNENKRLRSSI
ncbi:hypothetical protein U9M48_002741 [Paspalum notatum var. saurae]|uniref:Uncharacterized protein n=1 Tax=Paspalum notatum var. saurae TaxID=547442 RepID=A0AAQ3PI64_PASNO